MSQFFFPSILYPNSFRIKIVNNVLNFIQNEYTIESLSFFLSKEIASTYGYKKGGLNKTIIEILRFYLKNFNFVLDNSINKFFPLLNSYEPKYKKIGPILLKKKFSSITKYNIFQYTPNFKYFSLPAIFIDYGNRSNDSSISGRPLGLLYNDNFEKHFNLLFISNFEIKRYKDQLIHQISFFENLDLYREIKKFHKLRNFVGNIWNTYSDYEESLFIDQSISYNIDFLTKINDKKDSTIDNESLLHIFTTRKIKSGFQVHPELRNFIHYRNKITLLYTSINYFLHIYDPNGRDLSRIRKMFDILIKNIFSNGFIVHYYSGFFNFNKCTQIGF